VITGPTAVGKSALALALAEEIDAEIISADSRQIYRFMDIGTAKPTLEERRRVPHHLVDFVDPGHVYSVAEFQDDAERALAEVERRGKVALLVGGSVHYLQAVVDRLEVPRVPPQPDLRRELETFAATYGAEALHRRLQECDPAAAAAISASNVRRVVRALEVFLVTGRPFSQVGRRRRESRPALLLALTADRSELYTRIDRRVDDMIARGWLDEVQRLLDMGYSLTLPSMTSSGYRELAAHLRGELSLVEAVARTKFSTHAFARRQYVWLRKDPRLEWFAIGPQLLDHVRRRVEAYLRERRGDERRSA
jgi:tRNA dimethylallyltransferase